MRGGNNLELARKRRWNIFKMPTFGSWDQSFGKSKFFEK
jgi:hypothetical protein